MTASGAILGVLALTLVQDEGARLATEVKKGEKYETSVVHGLKSTLGEGYPLDIELTALIAYEVLEVDASGTARIRGALRKFSVAGQFPMTRERIDVSWDNTGDKPVWRGHLSDEQRAELAAEFVAKLSKSGSFDPGSPVLKSQYVPAYFESAFWGSLSRAPEKPMKVGSAWTTAEKNKAYDGKVLDVSVKHVYARDEKDCAVVESAYAGKLEDSEVVFKGETATHYDRKRRFAVKATGKYAFPIVKTADRGEIVITFEVSTTKTEAPSK